MDEFLKMDIFFFIATLAVVLFAIFGAIVLWRLAQVLKNIEHITAQASLESDAIRADLADMRSDIRRGKSRIASLLRFFRTTTRRASKDT